MRLFQVIVVAICLAAAATGAGEFDELLRQGLVALEQNDLAGARDHLEQASRLRPGEARVWLALAQTYARLSDPAKAGKAAGKAASLGGEEPAIQHGLAIYYANTGDAGKAAEYESRYAAASGDGTALERAAGLYLDAGNGKQAEALARQALEKDDRASLHNLLGKACEAVGNSAGAVIELQKAVEMNRYEESYHYDLARVLMLHHNFNVAIQVLEASKGIFARSPQLELALGVAYYGQRRFSDAVDAFLRTIELAPDVTQPYVYLSRILDDALERIGAVEARFRAYNKAHPESSLGPYLVAKAIIVQLPPRGFSVRAAEAERLLRTSLKRDDKPWETHYLLGSLLERKGSLEEAKTRLESAIELNPAEPAPHLPLARVYLKTGRQEDARREQNLFKELTRKQESAIQERASHLKRLKLKVE